MSEAIALQPDSLELMLDTAAEKVLKAFQNLRNPELFRQFFAIKDDGTPGKPSGYPVEQPAERPAAEPAPRVEPIVRPAPTQNP
jgi:hypothetical protein